MYRHRACGIDDRPSRIWLLPLLFLSLSAAACERARTGDVLVAVNLGAPFLDGARLALEDELGQAPIPGLDTILIPEPTNRSDVAILHAEDLVTYPALSVVLGHSNSTSSLAAAPVYNEHHIVQIAPTSTAPAYSEAGPFSFRLVPTDDRQGAFLARRIANDFPGGARLVVFFVNDDYGRGLRARFIANLDGDRHPIVADIPHLEETLAKVDVQTGIETARAADPDVIVWLARATPLRRFLPDLRREFGALPMYGGDGVGNVAPPPDQAELWDGIAYSDFLDPDATPEARAFAERFRQRWGRNVGSMEILAYDAMRLALTAFRNGHRSGPEVRDWLRSLGDTRPPFEGLSGPIAFDENGDVERDYVLRVIDEHEDR